MREFQDQRQQQQTTSNEPSTGYEAKSTSSPEGTHSHRQEKPPTETHQPTNTNPSNTSQVNLPNNVNNDFKNSFCDQTLIF